MSQNYNFNDEKIDQAFAAFELDRTASSEEVERKFKPLVQSVKDNPDELARVIAARDKCREYFWNKNLPVLATDERLPTVFRAQRKQESVVRTAKRQSTSGPRRLQRMAALFGLAGAVSWLLSEVATRESEISSLSSASIVRVLAVNSEAIGLFALCCGVAVAMIQYRIQTITSDIEDYQDFLISKNNVKRELSALLNYSDAERIAKISLTECGARESPLVGKMRELIIERGLEEGLLTEPTEDYYRITFEPSMFLSDSRGSPSLSPKDLARRFFGGSYLQSPTRYVRFLTRQPNSSEITSAENDVQ